MFVIPLLIGVLGAATPLKSVAVLRLDAKGTLSADTAELLTTHVVTLLREDGRFSRVVGMQEMQTTLGFDREQQLLSCSADSCLAQIAGALGVDFIVFGSVGRLGPTWLVNLSLVEMAGARARASVSQPIDAQDESGLLTAMPQAVVELLQKSGVPPVGPGLVAKKPVVTGGQEAQPSGPLGRALRGSGAALTGVGGLGLVVAAVAGAASLGLWLVMFVAPQALLGVAGRGALLGGGYWAGLAVGGLSLVLGVLAAMAGAAFLVGGFVMG